MNISILFLHIFLVSALTLFFLRQGKEASIAYLAVLGIAANLFVHKQIDLFGLSVTCSDALAVGYLLGANLIQEFFGRKTAKKTIGISLFLSAAFVMLSFIHLAYQPNIHDTTHSHFVLLLKPMPRIMIASVLSFLIVQFLDLSFFSYLRSKTEGRFLTGRVFLSAVLAHGLDTILFSFLGLYGIVHDITTVMLFSFLVKMAVVLVSTPFVMLSKRMIRAEI